MKPLRIGSMGLVSIPTFAISNQPNVGTYTRPMDGMGS